MHNNHQEDHKRIQDQLQQFQYASNCFLPFDSVCMWQSSVAKVYPLRICIIKMTGRGVLKSIIRKCVMIIKKIIKEVQNQLQQCFDNHNCFLPFSLVGPAKALYLTPSRGVETSFQVLGSRFFLLRIRHVSTRSSCTNMANPEPGTGSSPLSGSLIHLWEEGDIHEDPLP